MVRTASTSKIEVSIIQLRDGREPLLHITEHGATGKMSSIKVPIGARPARANPHRAGRRGLLSEMETRTS